MPLGNAFIQGVQARQALERRKEAVKLEQQRIKLIEAEAEQKRQMLIERMRLGQQLRTGGEQGPTMQAGQNMQQLSPAQQIGLQQYEQGGSGDLAAKAFGGGKAKTPEVQTFESLVGQGYKPIDALREVAGTKQALNEVGLALQASGGDPSGALAIMRQQRQASRAQTNISIGEKAAMREEEKNISSSVVTQDINRIFTLMENATFPTTGAGGALLSRLPGTDAANIRYLIDGIRANIGFRALQQMRQTSPTGGALGQVSDQENKLLQSTLGSLEQAQSQEQLAYNLKRVHDLFLDIVHGENGGPPRLLPPDQRISRKVGKVKMVPSKVDDNDVKNLSDDEIKKQLGIP